MNNIGRLYKEVVRKRWSEKSGQKRWSEVLNLIKESEGLIERMGGDKGGYWKISK